MSTTHPTLTEALTAYPRPDGARLTPHERRAALADFLDWLAECGSEQSFDLETWVSDEAVDEQGYYTAACGTTACAAGWATWLFRDPDFRLAPSRTLTTSPLRGAQWKPRSPGGFMGAEAVRIYFDLAEEQPLYIFYPAWYPTSSSPSPRDVARRLRDSAGGEGEPHV